MKTSEEEAFEFTMKFHSGELNAMTTKWIKKNPVWLLDPEREFMDLLAVYHSGR